MTTTARSVLENIDDATMIRHEGERRTRSGRVKDRDRRVLRFTIDIDRDIDKFSDLLDTFKKIVDSSRDRDPERAVTLVDKHYTIKLKKQFRSLGDNVEEYVQFLSDELDALGRSPDSSAKWF